MYGDGNTAKLVSDITTSTTQISNGLLDGMGISLKDLVGSVLTGRAIGAGLSAGAQSAAPTAVEEAAKEPVFTSDEM